MQSIPKFADRVQHDAGNKHLAIKGAYPGDTAARGPEDLYERTVDVDALVSVGMPFGLSLDECYRSADYAWDDALTVARSCRDPLCQLILLRAYRRALPLLRPTPRLGTSRSERRRLRGHDAVAKAVVGRMIEVAQGNVEALRNIPADQARAFVEMAGA